MPALRSEGSVVALKNGKYRADLVVGWDTQGRKIVRSRKCRTRAQARAALRELANERDAGGTRNQGKARAEALLGDYCQAWLTKHIKEKGIEPSTAAGYESVLRVWIRPHAGGKRLSQVTATTVKQVMTAMAGTKSSKRQAWIVLNAALRQAAHEGLIARNPCDGLTPPVVKTPRIEPPMDDDIEAIYEAILGDPDEARWLIALTLGLRQGEALGLEWRDIDLDAMTITIRQQLVRQRGVHGCGTPKPRGVHRGNDWPCGHTWASKCPQGTAGGLVLKQVKTERGNRVIPLLPTLVPILKGLQERQAKARMRPGTRWQPPSTGTGRSARVCDFVFRHPTGRPLDPKRDWDNWQAVLKSSGLEPTRLHNARHSAAIGMLDSGMPIERLADLLGHSSSAFSHRTYGHFSRQAADAARDALEAHHSARRASARRRRVKGVTGQDQQSGLAGSA